ncbi:hypothetical protein LCGC14_1887660 [marine sediment metagenome]|uniref:Uncharacterized protein n=1 Tax=marine sediment metagenome TaxID=412755 RepID=A0A0F9IYN1_9ZZZZ
MIAWYIAPYKIELDDSSGRYCAMNDYTNQIIYIDKGNWSESEVLGDRAVVKVNASASTLAALDSVFERMPKDGLDDSLSAVSISDKLALKNEGLDMGYSNAEWEEEFPNNLDTYQLKDILQFYTKRRLKPRFDGNKIIIDGIEQVCRTIESVDAEVQ